jgi:hypothetical protein
MNNSILSTALHDIYNEINNLFFLSESLMMDCHCLSQDQKNHFQQDFFNIIKQIKSKQFIFNNLNNSKPISMEDFKKYTNGLIPIDWDHNYEIATGLLCGLSIVKKSMEIKNHIIHGSIQKRYDQSHWAMVLIKNYTDHLGYKNIFNNHELIIEFQ